MISERAGSGLIAFVHVCDLVSEFKVSKFHS